MVSGAFHSEDGCSKRRLMSASCVGTGGVCLWLPHTRQVRNSGLHTQS